MPPTRAGTVKGMNVTAMIAPVGSILASWAMKLATAMAVVLLPDFGHEKGPHGCGPG